MKVLELVKNYLSARKSEVGYKKPLAAQALLI